MNSPQPMRGDCKREGGGGRVVEFRIGMRAQNLEPDVDCLENRKLSDKQTLNRGEATSAHACLLVIVSHVVSLTDTQCLPDRERQAEMTRCCQRVIELPSTSASGL